MHIPLRLQNKLYPYSFYFPSSFLKLHFRTVAESSPSLQALGPEMSSKVAELDIAYDVGLRHNLLTTLACSAAYVLFIFTIINLGSEMFFTITIIGGALLITLTRYLRWRLDRSMAENLAVVQLFFTVAFLEENAAEWPHFSFRWEVAQRLEDIVRKVERIPPASRSLPPNVKQEAFRISRAKAQAIRQLEIWVIQPMAFTFTDLVHRLTLDLSIIVDNRWYDLPEEDGFEIEDPRWAVILLIGSTIAIIGVISFLAVFTKINPAAVSILTVVLTLAVTFLSSAVKSTGVMDLLSPKPRDQT